MTAFGLTAPQGGSSFRCAAQAPCPVPSPWINCLAAHAHPVAGGCREPLAITVAATNQEDERLWISSGVASNFGKCVHLWAPGSHIESADNESDTATHYRSGTSQAVPFVAGAIALYLENATGEHPAHAPRHAAACAVVWHRRRSTVHHRAIVVMDGLHVPRLIATSARGRH